MHRNLSTVSTKQQRVATLAKQSPQMGFTSLAYLMDIDWLLEAYRRIRKDAAAGVDGVTATDYEANLEGNLQALLDRTKAGTYRAPPVRRVHIPKGDSAKDTRPIGIPTLEDKILQRAVVMLLEPIYEQDFYDCSFGFRTGRSAHQALEALRNQTMDSHGGWILEVDIQKFFDTLDHAHLRAFLKQRVRDGVLLRLIDKWLQAGVMEDGAVTTPEAGSPQGGVISPLLSNVYLHYVLDEWFEKEVKPRLRGQAFLIRYADDFVMGFTQEEDAKRVQAVLPQRLGKYGLAIHPEKTRLVPFRRPPLAGGGSGSGSGDLTGSVHLIGVHPLLGTFAAGELGGDAQDGLQSSQSGGAEHSPVVSVSPARPDRRATTHIESEVTRSLRVLRHHRQHALAGMVPLCSRALLAEVAESPRRSAAARLGSLQSSVAASPAAAAESGPLRVRSRSQSMI